MRADSETTHFCSPGGWRLAGRSTPPVPGLPPEPEERDALRGQQQPPKEITQGKLRQRQKNPHSIS
ncbi:hypothetical protein DV515_00001340 [Chloebia gouldiae]|uniref:Uncharacterized protein n=1 Tax=Chloebia gouldiae TaxID=44316 RepID=A0A3L8SYY0_CHLGU|nr:hypothetical protein DV515_00001340 [Chloebia gouldiae]